VGRERSSDTREENGFARFSTKERSRGRSIPRGPVSEEKDFQAAKNIKIDVPGPADLFEDTSKKNSVSHPMEKGDWRRPKGAACS